ncbi:MAG TPA: choice-of-anchor P family protein [Gemmatimonadales bacterium]|nr:choice-of-anchor P family protein [Gemmatimonadales bacterium]
MNGIRMQWGSRVATLGLVVVLTTSVAVAGAAQTVAGQAYGTYVNTPLASSGQSPLAVLPAVSGTDGAEADAEGAAQNVPNVMSSDFLNSMTSGELGTGETGAQSTASVADINILNGLITADEVIANVMSSHTASGAVSNADGSTLQNVLVAGVPVTTGDAAVAPNTQIPLPGVGYVVLNEQIPTGDGVTSSGLTVNMIHVFLQDAITGLVTGEIIVGSAASSVSS